MMLDGLERCSKVIFQTWDAITLLILHRVYIGEDGSTINIPLSHTFYVVALWIRSYSFCVANFRKPSLNSSVSQAEAPS